MLSYFTSPTDKSQPDVHSISNLLQLLSNNVYIKKSKNVEVLHLAAEVLFIVYQSSVKIIFGVSFFRFYSA